MSDPELPGLMLGHYDANRATPTIDKVMTIAAAFREKYGVEAAYVLTNMADAAELEGCPLEVRPATFVSRFCYYVGLRP